MKNKLILVRYHGFIQNTCIHTGKIDSHGVKSKHRGMGKMWLSDTYNPPSLRSDCTYQLVAYFHRILPLHELLYTNAAFTGPSCIALQEQCILPTLIKLFILILNECSSCHRFTIHILVNIYLLENSAWPYFTVILTLTVPWSMTVHIIYEYNIWQSSNNLYTLRPS